MLPAHATGTAATKAKDNGRDSLFDIRSEVATIVNNMLGRRADTAYIDVSPVPHGGTAPRT